MRTDFRLFLVVTIVSFLVLKSNAQTYPRWEGNTLTFEIDQPPKDVSDREAWRNLERSNSENILREYELTAMEILGELNNGMTKLTDPSVSDFNKSLIKSYIIGLFKDAEVARPAINPTYRGLAFDSQSNSISLSGSKSLENYLDFLLKSSRDKLKMNICWGLDEAEESFKFKKMATQRLRPSSQKTMKQDTLRSYIPYKAKLTVKEYAAFNTFTVDDRICKNVNFEIRAFEREFTDDLEPSSFQDYYRYAIILKSVTINSDDSDCKKLQPDCDPESPVDNDEVIEENFSMNFDFGNGKSTRGYENVTSSTKYSDGNNYGYISSGVIEAYSECSQNGLYCENSLEEDYLVFKTGDKFRAKVSKGYYFVRGVLNESSSGLVKSPKSYKLKLENQWKRIPNNKDGVTDFVYKVEVEDGFLDLEFGTLGGTSKVSHVPFSVLEIKENVLWFDFGPGEVADSFVQVQKKSIYAADKGFGIKTFSDVIGEGEKKYVKSQLLNDSLVLKKGAIFKCNIPNGSYDVEVVTTDFKSGNIRAEDKKVKEKTFKVLVKDDQLDMEFMEATSVNGLKIANAGCYKVVSNKSYLLPGQGFNELRKRKGKNFPIGNVITLATLGSIGTGIYFKIESDKQYKIHRNASTFDELNSSYEKANFNHHNFLIFTGAGIATWLVSSAVIMTIDGSQFRKCRNNFEEEQIESTTSNIPKIELKTADAGVGLGLNVTF